MAKISYQKLDDHSLSFWALLAAHVVVIAAALGAAFYMEHNGHVVSGMNNQVVWGTPHVFAVFLIVAASGALNVASVSSVFNRLAYKPYARLSAILAVSLLVGGLAVLVLDLGRPDRLIVAMTTYNFKSIFAWNIYLYTGFLAVVAAYLFVMMDRKVSQWPVAGKAMGAIAFVWRLVLTTGTGSIFGFLAARELYDSAMLAPIFIAASFLYGLAFTVLVLVTMARETRQDLMPEEMVGKFRGLLIIFALTVIYLTAVFFVTKLYSHARQDAAMFILRDGGIYTAAFWIGQILIGTLLPILFLLPNREGRVGRLALTAASVLFLIGGIAHMYVTIIGGQAQPLDLLPGMNVSSSFQDGSVAHYVPSLPEVVLGIGGISMAMFIAGVALKLLPFLPNASASTSASAARN
jgi:molybdopterin-containing oxidoreductase family membrane subunit